MWVCVCMGFVMCGCFDNCVGVLVICVLVRIYCVLYCLYYVFVLFLLCIKQSRNRLGVAQRVPGDLGSQIFMIFGT